jgi:hypothetical protein
VIACTFVQQINRGREERSLVILLLRQNDHGTLYVKRGLQVAVKYLFHFLSFRVDRGGVLRLLHSVKHDINYTCPNNATAVSIWLPLSLQCNDFGRTSESKVAVATTA